MVFRQPGGWRSAGKSVLVARVEVVPGTVVTPVDGSGYQVLESLPPVLDRLHAHHASQLAETARSLEAGDRHPALRLPQGGRRR